MSRFKTALRIASAAAFAVPAILALLSFCTFTFYNGETLAGEFSLSPLQLLMGTEVSGQAISNPLLGASFFLIPLMGLACCLIKSDDTRASVTGVTSIIGFVYIRFVTDRIIPSAVYTRSAEQAFAESFSSDRATYGMTAVGNMMWIFYIIALALALTTFVIFLHEIRVNANNSCADDEYYSDDESWSEDGENGYFDVVDEINPGDYDGEAYTENEGYEEASGEAYDEADFAPYENETEENEDESSIADEEFAAENEPEADETDANGDEAVIPPDEPKQDEKATTDDDGAKPGKQPIDDAAQAEADTEEASLQKDNEDPPLVITDDVDSSSPHETDIVFKKLNFNLKKSSSRPRLAVEKATATPGKPKANLCPKCKNELRPGTVFCKKCGTRIDPKECGTRIDPKE